MPKLQWCTVRDREPQVLLSDENSSSVKRLGLDEQVW
jgi:hypothetical protein